VQETIRRAQWCKVDGVYRLSELPPIDVPKAYDIGIVNLAQHYRMRRGDFAVVTGLPGHGKSSFVNEACCRMAQLHGWNTVFASFEQSPQVDHRRSLRSYYGGKLEKFMDQGEIERADAWIDRRFAFIVPDEDDDISLTWVLERCAAAIIRYEAQIVVIDPWNEMDHVRPPDMTLTEYIGFAIKQFRKLAKKYRVHLIVVAHPAKMQRGKDGTYPVPGMWDISDSAHWANKADVGIVIHRPDFNKGDTTIKVVKSRYHNAIGRPGEISGIWSEETGRYTIIGDTP
jgi:twinkle protein